jgi:hypothetical protein
MRPNGRGNVGRDRKLTVALLADGLFRDAVSFSGKDLEGSGRGLLRDPLTPDDGNRSSFRNIVFSIS